MADVSVPHLDRPQDHPTLTQMAQFKAFTSQIKHHSEAAELVHT